MTGSVRHWPGVWSVQGSGSRLLSSANPGAATLTALTGGPSESWTINVPDKFREIAIWEMPGTGRIRIASQHGQLTHDGAIVVNTSAGDTLVGKMEQALSSQSANVQLSVVPGQTLSVPRPGILVVNFADEPVPNLAPPASYSLILQVEKVGKVTGAWRS